MLRHDSPLGGGGYSLIISMGVCCLVIETLYPFQSKNYYFPIYTIVVHIGKYMYRFYKIILYIFYLFFYLKTLIPRICRSNNFVIRHSPDHDAIHVLLYITMTGWTSKSIYFIIHIFLVIIIFLVATFYKFVCRCNLFSVPFNNMQTHAAFKQWLRFLLLPIILDILADISGNRS